MKGVGGTGVDMEGRTFGKGECGEMRERGRLSLGI